MRTLVVADVHGNLAALEAVLAEPHDSLVCVGDLVGFGPATGQCVRRIREATRVVVQGNHDEAAAHERAPDGPEPFHTLAEAMMPVARAQIGARERAYLRALPRWAFVELDGMRCMLVHATPRNPLYRPLGPDPTAWLEELEGVDADVVLVGHTHVPFDLPLGRTRVVNPGSVGFPMDGDPRASYAVIDNGRITLERATYPVEETLESLSRSGASTAAAAALGVWVLTGSIPPVSVDAPQTAQALRSASDI